MPLIRRWSNECINEHSLCKQYRAAQRKDKGITGWPFTREGPWRQSTSLLESPLKRASLPPFSSLSFSNNTTRFLQTPSSNKRSPSRLLNIQSVDNDVVWVQDVCSFAIVPSYATISHRWGNPTPPKLLRSNQAELTTGIKLSTLPKSFRDSIAIARTVGLTHIWIDSLCIVQMQPGEEEDPEWTQEINNMGAIYASGVFNIAIVASENSEGGCFTNPQQHLLPILDLPCWAWETGGDTSKKPSAGPWVLYERYSSMLREEVLNPILYGRGWVHQELHLSPATLYCTAKQLWWSCPERTSNQSYPQEQCYAHIPFLLTAHLTHPGQGCWHLSSKNTVFGCKIQSGRCKDPTLLSYSELN